MFFLDQMCMYRDKHGIKVALFFFIIFPEFSLQSGCCKPPTMCGYTFVNPTYWISPINTAADVDCVQWSNDQSQLCFACDSCKAGLLANLRRGWRKADVILIFTCVALIIVYLIGCCAFRNAKTEEIFDRYKQGYV